LTPDKMKAIIESPSASASASEGPTVVVIAESDLHTIADHCKDLRQHQIKTVGCCVRGVVGMVCDDFLEGFEVIDPDGEFYREVSTVSYVTDNTVCF
jgi:hypothetical protein